MVTQVLKQTLGLAPGGISFGFGIPRFKLPESGLIVVTDGGSGLNKVLLQKYLGHDKK